MEGDSPVAGQDGEHVEDVRIDYADDAWHHHQEERDQVVHLVTGLLRPLDVLADTLSAGLDVDARADENVDAHADLSETHESVELAIVALSVEDDVGGVLEGGEVAEYADEEVEHGEYYDEVAV